MEGVISEAGAKTEKNEDHVVPPPPIPAEQLDKYSVDRDPHSERDIAAYVVLEADDETVQHVEKIKQEIVLGEKYEIWDVTTDTDRWWVITNLTNLYSQRHFPSLDHTLSLHIGLMMRLRSRQSRVDGNDPGPFDEVFRRGEQAEQRLDSAIEAEDYQAVGMLLRECLISLTASIRRRTEIPVDVEQPHGANFVAWTDLLTSQLCGGSHNRELRQHLKTMAKSVWQLVNWLTHARGANRTASAIAMHSCQTVIGQLIQALERQ